MTNVWVKTKRAIKESLAVAYYYNDIESGQELDIDELANDTTTQIQTYIRESQEFCINCGELITDGSSNYVDEYRMCDLCYSKEIAEARAEKGG